MGFASGRKIFIAGSTAPGEDAVIADAYCELRKNFPQLALTIAPRHLERSARGRRHVARGLAQIRESVGTQFSERSRATRTF